VRDEAKRGIAADNMLTGGGQVWTIVSQADQALVWVTNRPRRTLNGSPQCSVIINIQSLQPPELAMVAPGVFQRAVPSHQQLATS
jgi:hypothetical protein